MLVAVGLDGNVAGGADPVTPVACQPLFPEGIDELATTNGEPAPPEMVAMAGAVVADSSQYPTHPSPEKLGTGAVKAALATQPALEGLAPMDALASRLSGSPVAWDAE